MNVPETHELFELPFGKQKVEYEVDTKIPNSGNFTIYLEDHTIGNLLRMQLLDNPEVKFAGYRKPHPLENKIEIKIQTTETTKPDKVLEEALKQLIVKTDSLKQTFAKSLENFVEDNKVCIYIEDPGIMLKHKYDEI